MRLLGLAAPLLILVCAGCHRPPVDSPGAVERAESLSPGDIEADKYLFEAQAGKNQVVVFRSEKFLNGKLTDSNDIISNQRDQRVTFSVLVLNRTFFSQFTGVSQSGYIFKLPNGEWDVSEQFRSSTTNTGSTTYVFHDASTRQSNEIKIVLSIFTESYEKAKQEVPDLSPDEPNSSWGYSFTKVMDGQPFAPKRMGGEPLPAPRQ